MRTTTPADSLKWFAGPVFERMMTGDGGDQYLTTEQAFLHALKTVRVYLSTPVPLTIFLETAGRYGWTLS